MPTTIDIGKSVNRKQYSHISKINGIDLYYEFYPNQNANKTLFLIHGFLASSFSFRYIIPELMKQYQIIAVDIPPFGRSGKDLKYTFSYENIAATFIQLIHKLQLKNVSLIGHSMGGQIGLYMALQQPEIFDKIILFASSGYLQQVRKSLIFLSYLPFAHIFVKKKLVDSGGVEGNLLKVVYDKNQITEDMIQGYLEPFIENDAIFHALAKFSRDREGDLSKEDLNKINTPCLLVWGAQDRIVPLQVGKRLNQDLPNSNLVVLEKTGHLTPEERPDETCRLIKEFVG